MKREIKEIIDRELNYFQKAYPRQKELLDKFANKLAFEIILKIEQEKEHTQNRGIASGRKT